MREADSSCLRARSDKLEMYGSFCVVFKERVYSSLFSEKRKNVLHSEHSLRIGVRTSVESFETSQNSRQAEDDVDKTRRKVIDVTGQS